MDDTIITSTVTASTMGGTPFVTNLLVILTNEPPITVLARIHAKAF